MSKTPYKKVHKTLKTQKYKYKKGLRAKNNIIGEKTTDVRRKSSFILSFGIQFQE